jgi:hypothetical protein
VACDEQQADFDLATTRLQRTKNAQRSIQPEMVNGKIGEQHERALRSAFRRSALPKASSSKYCAHASYARSLFAAHLNERSPPHDRALGHIVLVASILRVVVAERYVRLPDMARHGFCDR